MLSTVSAQGTVSKSARPVSLVEPKVFEKNTSLNPEKFENADWRRADARDARLRHAEYVVRSDTKEFSGFTVAFFAVAYICARYAVGIEHPWQWYQATRMKNYTKDDYELD
jgi:hypothetical protein